MKQLSVPLIGALALCACASEGVSTTEVKRAAEQRVRQDLRLTEDAKLQTTVVVGREYNGEPTLCGTVTGTKADGTAIPRQRFISASSSIKWLLFGETHSPGRVSMPSMSADWTALCAGADGRQS